MKIGLTGGIGSGKSTVAKVFEILGIPVYYADDAAKRLMNRDPALRDAIIHHFGNGAYNKEGLDRKYLAGIVFNNKEKLELLNSLTHPVTLADSEEWMNAQTSPYIVREAALLFESGADKTVDQVIGVYAPQHIRVKRVMDRDHLTIEEVMKRVSRQLDEEEKMKRCDFIISNNETELVIPQVIELDKKFRKGTK